MSQKRRRKLTAADLRALGNAMSFGLIRPPELTGLAGGVGGQGEGFGEAYAGYLTGGPGA
jgi:hypothetical protein